MMCSPRFFASRLALPLAAHADAPLPGLVDLAQLLLRVGDLPAGGEVRPLDVLEEILGLELAVVDERDRRLADLLQVVRRDVGRHADRDAGAAVDQQLRHLGRQHDRLLGGAVVVGAKVDRALLDLVEQLHRQRRQARLGVAVGGGRVAVERAEVAVPLDQRVAQREVLRHRGPWRRRPRRRRAGGTCPAPRRRWSRTCGTWRRGRGGQVVVHRVQDPALHRLEAVAHVGQRARRDDADRVVEVAPLGLGGERRGVDRGGGSPSPRTAGAARAAARASLRPPPPGSLFTDTQDRPAPPSPPREIWLSRRRRWFRTGTSVRSATRAGAA